MVLWDLEAQWVPEVQWDRAALWVLVQWALDHQALHINFSDHLVPPISARRTVQACITQQCHLTGQWDLMVPCMDHLISWTEWTQGEKT